MKSKLEVTQGVKEIQTSNIPNNNIHISLPPLQRRKTWVQCPVRLLYGAILYRLRDTMTFFSRKSRNFYTPPVLAPRRGWSCRNFAKIFDTHKTRMIGLPCVVTNYDNMLSRFHRIPERDWRTDRQTDASDRIAVSISRVSVLTIARQTHD